MKDTSEPTYVERKTFYIFGFLGEHDVDVNEVCGGAEVEQMQTIMTARDYFMGIVTFFVYAPRTVKVWCGQ